jgi:hypothetical protein
MSIKNQQFSELLNLFPPQPIIDLGCGGCPFVGVMQSRGFKVQAIDINSQRVPKKFLSCFKKGNALSADLSFADLILCSGLLYHLTISEQERLKRALSGKTVLLDTHYTSIGRKSGKYSGVYRKPTSSTASRENVFVHTLSSIHALFNEHLIMQACPHVFERSWLLMIPKYQETDLLKQQ